MTTKRFIEVIEKGTPAGTRAFLQGLPAGHSCRIVPDSKRAGIYVRITSNGSVHGRRYMLFPTYERAIKAAMEWADRKCREAAARERDVVGVRDKEIA